MPIFNQSRHDHLIGKGAIKRVRLPTATMRSPTTATAVAVGCLDSIVRIVFSTYTVAEGATSSTASVSSVSILPAAVKHSQGSTCAIQGGTIC
jgi:hypothetical protein